MVRRTVSYDRYDTPVQLALLQRIYEDLRYYVNFFQPVLKLVGKKHIQQGKYVKTYDQATTPFRRVLRAEGVAVRLKAALANQYFKLNPVALRNRIDDNVVVLWRLSR